MKSNSPFCAFLKSLSFLLQRHLSFLEVFLVPAKDSPHVCADLTLYLFLPTGVSKEPERLRAAGGFKTPGSDQLHPSLLWSCT